MILLYIASIISLYAAKLAFAPYALDDSLPIRENTIAHCFSGDVRGFPTYWPNTKHVTSSISQGMDVVNYFYSMRFTRDQNNIFNMSSLMNALSQMEPTDIHLLDSSAGYQKKNISCDPETEYPLPWDSEGIFWTNQLANQFHSFEKVYQLVQRQEISQGWRYEFMTRLRPDLMFKQDVGKLGLNATKARDGFVHVFDYTSCCGIPGMSDYFGLMNRKAGHVYFSAVHFLDYCWRKDSYDMNCEIMNNPPMPECTLAGIAHLI